MKKFNELRSKYPQFIYEGYDISNEKEKIKIQYHFTQSEEISFSPEWVLPFSYDEYKNSENKAFIDYLVFNLGMAELVSYWKAACSPKVKIKCGFLNEAQIMFWKKLYFNGLGEFFYTNGIDTDINSFMNIDCECDSNKQSRLVNVKAVKGALIPVGGGKDSVVTLEMLKDFKNENSCFVINGHGASIKTANTAGYDDEKIYSLTRRLDRKIVELNSKGFLNGHTPFSAVIAFSSYLTAFLAGKQYIILSNESSANEVYVKDTSVNHQYSKSVEFENDFREYTEKYLSFGCEYFSFLRAWNEFRIVKEFTKHPKYFKVFNSCNLGSKSEEWNWCCNCSKCLYVYIMLSPFVNAKEIFGKNLLDDENMLGFLDGLVSEQFDKPFECIGTRQEINCALSMCIEQTKDKANLPLLLKKYYEKYYKPEFYNDVYDFFDTNNNIPEKYKKYLRCKSANDMYEEIENYFRGKSVLILGYGREGKSTFNLLKDFVPYEKLAVADKNSLSPEENPELCKIKTYFGENYLSAIKDYDIIMQSPGIALLDLISEADKKKITSQTDLFLKYCQNKKIGVTGTKGKSTTASLIYHLLYKSGRSCVLLGNIGIPPLSRIDTITDDMIIVLEMSCHQLEYVHASPDVSVLLNVYSEHLDHYVSFEAYRDAKFNIFKYQDERGTLIYNSDCENMPHEYFDFLKQRTIKASDKLIDGNDFCCLDGENVLINLNEKTKKIAFDEINTKLMGRHNIYNVAIALTACKLVGLDFDNALKVLPDFAGLEHRLEYVGNFGNINYYNDSISTVPETAIAAVSCFKHVDTLLVGGMDRGIDYNDFAEFLFESDIDNIIFMPDSGWRVLDIIKELGVSDKKLVKVNNLSEAVDEAKKLTVDNGVVLLSPAAASYGFFKNFEERGKAYKKMIKS